MADVDSSVDILMVEDNANDEALTLHELQKYHLTNRIQVVRDGQEALEYIFCTGRYETRDIKSQPHVILLDIKLPYVDGLEILRRIKQDQRTRTIPVVMLTSSREERDLIKPVDFDQFKESARTLGMYWLLLNRPPKAA
jgi:two-component system response regulator